MVLLGWDERRLDNIHQFTGSTPVHEQRIEQHRSIEGPASFRRFLRKTGTRDSLRRGFPRAALHDVLDETIVSISSVYNSSSVNAFFLCLHLHRCVRNFMWLI